MMVQSQRCLKRKVVEAVETAKKEWDEAYSRAKEHIKAIEEYGKSREE